MNVKSEGKAIIACIEMIGRWWWEGAREELEFWTMEGHQKWMGFRTIDMIKYGEEIVTEGMDNICGLAWKEGRVPENLEKGYYHPSLQGKG